MDTSHRYPIPLKAQNKEQDQEQINQLSQKKKIKKKYGLDWLIKDIGLK